MRILLVLLFCFETSAQYISALPNNHLKEELSEQPDRLIPSHDVFSAAIDGLVYSRDLGTDDFYHGTGHWTQMRTETRIKEHARLNTRSIFFTGSSSYGYSRESYNYHLFGFTGILPEYIKGFSFSGRAKDLERQNVGRGLILQDEELNGILLNFGYGPFQLKHIMEGTAGYQSAGDIDYTELSVWNERLGLGHAEWTDDSGTSDNRKILKDYFYLFSTIELSNRLSLDSEFGVQNSQTGYMVALQYLSKYLQTKAQYRRYQGGFLDEYIGNAQHLYTSLDQLDKDYTNPINILHKDNDVQAYSLKLDFRIPINQLFSFDAQNEIGRFDYSNIIHEDFYFFRTAIRYKPFVEREESISLYISNKILRNSFMTPPQNYDFSSASNFKMMSFFGADARIRF